MKSLFLCHLRPREPSAMLLTNAHTHAQIYDTYTQLFLTTIWPTFMCGGGNKDRITLDYLHESTTMGTSILMATDSIKLT